ncbi:Uncharacterized conserved protein YdeI, YjbR/CyaY-like superfamily, DUF1801 family [Modicisalibacter muralis]|uniref:Uncharacterized conserved protein YdeI, YjbR/CyaY-like superfamily, DUF1801 family n=1 Tax=Modicisalibacter muralis TaxID=119000 RepID=A0A1G9I0Q8_9GAMM|nr:DUF1801 domain-containing protein [Halomonas muralis]SDL18636.1 Uncharacterized conserved protein YdeI, YjbR/CyaY-like superfamily, DUF1801 family [Halomonas muralis]
MNSMNPKVDALLNKPSWQEERKALRAIALDCQLTEEVKWGKLCYTFQKNNVAMIYGLKEYCALGFFKGALLNDPDGVLVKPGEHSQAMRQIRFTEAGEISEMETSLKAYIHEAIEIEKTGLKVDFKEKHELEIPEELQEKLNRDPSFKTSFEALTLGRQRGYILHFSGAKQSRTRASRIEKCISRILDGKGLHDR